MPKVSIIVPVYGVEQYIERCIDSILAQTFTDWELLLIDDGSPDRSGEICNEYAAKDERITVFHKENRGVSSARNLGLDNAKSEWVTFIDADDFILAGFIEGLYKPIDDGENVDLVHGGCCNVKNGKIVGVNQAYDNYTGDDPGYVFKKFRGLTVSKLFCLENVNRGVNGLTLRFDEKMKIAEDMAFTLDYLLTVKRYAFVTEKGYCYRIDNMGSATKSHTVDYDCRLHEFIHLYESVHDYIKYHTLEPSVYEYRKANLGKILFNTILDLYRINIGKKERIVHIKHDFTVEHFDLLKFVSMDKMRKILICMLYHKFYQLFDICTYIALKLH